MTTLQRFASWLTRRAYGGNANLIVSSSLPSWDSAFRKWTQPSDFQALINRNLGLVYACASHNSQAVARARLRLYVAKDSPGQKIRAKTRALTNQEHDWLASKSILQKWIAPSADVEEILEHPFLSLLQNVNPWNNGFETLELIDLHQELTGNAYLFKVRSGLGAPAELWLLPSQWVIIEPDKQKFIRTYRYGPQEPRQELDPKDVIQFKFPNPRDLWYGMGPLQAALLATDLYTKMAEYEHTLFDNNARPDIALVTDQPLGEVESARIEHTWNAKFRGHKKAGKMALLSGGIDVKQLNYSPREMANLAGRKWTLEEIAIIFGIPISQLRSEDVNRANADAGNYTYAANTLAPRLIRMEQKLNEQLLPEFDERLFCAFDNPVPEDKEYRLREIQGHLSTGYSSINQERQKDNQEEVEWGNVPILPFNMAPLGSVAPQAQGQLGQEGQSNLSIDKAAKMPAGETPPTFERALVKVFRDQEKEAIANIDKHAQIDTNKWNPHLQEIAFPFLKERIEQGGERGIARVRERGKALWKQPFEIAWDITNPKVQEFLQQYLFRFSFAVNSTTNRALQNTIATGLEGGETIRQLTERVQGVFDFAQRYRAERIARTESARAYSAGAEAGYIQTGLVEGKEWIVSPGACEFCLEMQGKVVALGANYYEQGTNLTAGEKTMDLDYGDVESPPLHPDCVCDIAPVLIEVQP